MVKCVFIYSLPCKGAKFVLKRLKTMYNFEAKIIYLNVANKDRIFNEYKIDNEKIPSLFIGDKMIGYGKIRERDIKIELNKYKLIS